MGGPIDPTGHLVSCFVKNPRPFAAQPRFEWVVRRLAVDGYAHPLAIQAPWRPAVRSEEYVATLFARVFDVASFELPAEFDGSRFEPRDLRALPVQLNELLMMADRAEAGSFHEVVWSKVEQVAGHVLEPFLAKLIALLEKDWLLLKAQRDERIDLTRLVMQMSKLGRCPVPAEVLGLPTDRFVASNGWNDRDTVSNALRTAFGRRLATAHLAPAPPPEDVLVHVWCSIVLLVAFVEKSADVLLAQLGGNSLPAADLSPRNAHGLPARRRLPPATLEMATSRFSDRFSFLNAIQACVAQERGGVFLVSGPPGWGKTQLVLATLDASELPIRLVDVADLLTMAEVAECLLEGVAVRDSDVTKLDRNPTYAARVLANEVGGSASIIVLENCHAAHVDVIHGLPALIDRLRTAGFLIIVEGWSRITGSVPDVQFIPQRLDRDEVARWGASIIGRVLDPARELNSFEVLEGYPALVGAAFSELRERSPSTPGTPAVVDDVVLRILDTKTTMGTPWVRFARQEAGQGKLSLAPVLEAPILACFAMLPWSVIPEAALQASAMLTLSRLQPLHLVARREDPRPGWHGRPGIRALAHQQLSLLGRLPEGAIDLATSAAPETQPDDVERTRRHVAMLAFRGLVNAVELKQVLDALPAQAALPATGVLDDGYVAPAPAMSLVAGDSLPIDLRIWMLASALRRDREQDPDLQKLEQLQRLLLDGPALPNDIFSDWRLLKSVHRAVVAVPQRPLRLSFYRRVIGHFGPHQASSPALSAWRSSILVRAAETALATGDVDDARRWLGECRTILRALPTPEPGTHSVGFHADLAYRLTAAERHFSVSADQLVAAHWLALNTVPLISNPDHAGKWFHRWTRHAISLAELEGWTDRLESAAATALDGASPPQRVASFLSELGRRGRDDPKCVAFVRRQASVRIRSASRASDPGLKFQFRALAHPEALDEVIGWLAERLDPARPADHDDEMMLPVFLCLLVVLQEARRSPPTIAVRNHLATACRAALKHRRVSVLPNREIIALQRECMRYLRQLSLDALRSKIANWQQGLAVRPNIDSEMGAIAKSADRMFEDARSVHAGDWLWSDRADVRIGLAKQWSTLTRIVTPKYDIGDLQTERLLALVEAAELALPASSPALDLVRYRVFRYLWRFPESIAALRRLAASPLDSEGRTQLSEAVVLDLLPIVFVPALLRSSRSAGDETVGEATELFQEIARQIAPSTVNWATPPLLQSIRRIIVTPDDLATWQQVASTCKEALGQPGEFWRRVVSSTSTRREDPRASTQPTDLNVGDVLVDDLTDPRRLQLAAVLSRFGACREALPIELRRTLSEIAVLCSMGMVQWNRSFRKSDGELDRWQVGVSLVVALSLQPDRQLFGSELSLERRHRTGQRKSWVELAHDYVGIAAFGNFRIHVHEVAERLRTMLRAGESLSE